VGAVVAQLAALPSLGEKDQLCGARRRCRRAPAGVGYIDGRGDAADRWRDHLDRIDTALARDPATTADVAGHPLDATALAALTGLTWTDTVTTIVSLGPLAAPVVADRTSGADAP
jgi:hypothetical protein